MGGLCFAGLGNDFFSEEQRLKQLSAPGPRRGPCSAPEQCARARAAEAGGPSTYSTPHWSQGCVRQGVTEVVIRSSTLKKLW